MKKASVHHLNKGGLDGLVWIISGRVFVKNEMTNGMPPIINPCEGVLLFVNGQERNHLTTLRDTDEIELIATEYTINMEMSIEVSEDGLQAFLNYSPEKLIKNIIQDAYPINKLDVQVVQHTVETRNITVDQLTEFLKNSGIVYGIDHGVLEQICVKNAAGKFLVAEGLAAVNTEDDSIEYLFDNEEITDFAPKANDSGKIDYKNISVFQSVNVGQAIANVKKGKPGADGITVTGKTIPPQQANKITILPAFSINYDEDTGVVRANKPGRPFKQEKNNVISFQIYDYVSVEEVNMKTGNVHFKGDIEIKRNVCESMEVVAKQDIIIKGNTEFASIYAGNNITIKGTAISSKINAAMNDMVSKDPAPLLQKLTEGIDNLIWNMKQLQIDAPNTSFPELVRQMLNDKNRQLPMIVYEVISALRKDNYDVEDNFILSLMKKTRSLMGNTSEIEDLKALFQISSDLKKLFSNKTSTPVKGSITLSSAINCEVTALGNIHVLGRGCVNSKLTSGGKVIVTGYVRGGQIRAEKGIEVNIAGSERGSKIFLAVPQDSYIQIRSAFTDTIVKVGGLSYTFLSEKKKVMARIEKGKLLV
ncbi:MAG: DUF342 domain-containing protein [Thermoclostridium sp.]|nr:DUF342 domain-containing protein [Thermoclostridium sp.]